MESVANDVTGFLEIVGTDEVCGLNRKTHGNCTGQTAKQPDGALDQPNGRGSLSTEAAHHGLIYEEHHHVGDLSQDRGKTQLENQVEFIAGGHRLSVTDSSQQTVGTGFREIIHLR